MILNYLKDLNVTARMAADLFHVSDTYVHNCVLEYLNCDRLPLPEILSVDEVHLDFNEKNKYALVLMNFITGEIIDILPNRLKSQYQDYFYNIPYEERKKVKILVCDMYNPYINFAARYFSNATVIIDSFHVIQWIINKINIYINEVKKKYQERDRKYMYQDEFNKDRDPNSVHVSKEVFLLNKFRWLLLADEDNVTYYDTGKYYKQLDMTVDTYAIEDMFMKLDHNFKKIKELKEIYIEFNNSFPMESEKAEEQLNTIIKQYRKSDLAMFREFAELLYNHKIEIVNSFIDPRAVVSKKYEQELLNTKKQLRRISNGPMESFNRGPKDLKRTSRGFQNIEYTIKRIIWSNRDNEPVRGIPRSEKEIHTHTGVKRGKYNKKD